MWPPTSGSGCWGPGAAAWQGCPVLAFGEDGGARGGGPATLRELAAHAEGQDGGRAHGPSQPAALVCLWGSPGCPQAAWPGHVLPRMQQRMSPCAQTGAGARSTQPGAVAVAGCPGVLPCVGWGPGWGDGVGFSEGQAVTGQIKGPETPHRGGRPAQAGTGARVGWRPQGSTLWPPKVVLWFLQPEHRLPAGRRDLGGEGPA